MNENSYYYLANKDLIAAEHMFKAELYNHAARLCQQYLEKILKNYIFQHGEEGDYLLLSTHNLPKIASRIEELLNIKFEKDDLYHLRLLKDYYFDTNYPGDNFLELDYKMSKEALDFAKVFKEKYEEVLR